MMRTTILGLGNTLLRDEGFGVHFLHELDRKYDFPDDVKLIDGGTLGYGLLDTISSCDRLLVIDIIKSEAAPGSIYRFTQEEMELQIPAPTSAHEVEFFDVLSKAEMMGALPETIFLCIAPENYGGEMEIGLSPAMYEAYSAFEKLLLQELQEWDLKPSLKEALAGA
ncbi:MAG: HyaD/HybD family hydrogenase maturation endopeptidase [Deltaproteobacteria bacterium]|nr:HyaD/HybD family hydrogenase maturation endopeptidase [Deltaproteobacteria bacterium]